MLNRTIDNDMLNFVMIYEYNFVFFYLISKEDVL